MTTDGGDQGTALSTPLKSNNEINNNNGSNKQASDGKESDGPVSTSRDSSDNHDRAETDAIDAVNSITEQGSTVELLAGMEEKPSGNHMVFNFQSFTIGTHVGHVSLSSFLSTIYPTTL